jgi:glycerate kinase
VPRHRRWVKEKPPDDHANALSDGGEGLLVYCAYPGLNDRETVADPLGRNIQGRHGLSADRQTCVVEWRSQRLQRLTLAERDPRLTSTSGPASC